MTAGSPLRIHERWAQLRFSIVGPLLAAPPEKGELRAAIEHLAAKQWRHPVTGRPVRFGFSTVERWYHQARQAKNPVGSLHRKVRADAGQQGSVSAPLRHAISKLRKEHPTWSYQLVYDNLAALVRADCELGPLPSYSTVRRYMVAQGLLRRRRLTTRDTAGAKRAQARLERREVRSFEAEHVHGLWHADYHHGSRKVLTPAGTWLVPLALGILDDRSRLACHVQWYLAESAENLVHGLSQGFQKRGLPRGLMTDNGSAMRAEEVTQGLQRLGILHYQTLPYSAYQNAKQEVFWAQLEGRFMAMLEGVEDLTLESLNHATQAWVEMEYQHKLHSETGQSPLDRCLQGPSVGRPSPDSDTLRCAFTAEVRRTQRRSDGTVTLNGRRFEIPSRYRTLQRLCVRFASWDLTQVHLADERTGELLCRLWPLDKARNADGRRRALPVKAADPLPSSGMAPLLTQLMADYAATGLPPAYLPKPKEQVPEAQNPPSINPEDPE
jgi:putative transposase